MKHLNWWQNLMMWLGHIDLDDAAVKFKVNLALKEHGRKMRAIGVEEGEKSKADCKACFLWQSDQRRKLGLYDDPSPTTDGKIRAERMDGTAIVIPRPQGRYFQKRRKEFITTKLMPVAERPDGFPM